MRKFFGLMGMLALVAFGQVAQAALTSSAPPTCSVSDVMADGIASADGCSGAWLGNTTEQEADVLAQIFADWGVVLDLAGKSDDANFGPFTSNPEATSGTLTFDAAISGPFVIALKAGSEFSLYYFDSGNTGVDYLTFVTNGAAANPQGRPQALSHADLYTVDGVPPTVIPEPETYAMLLAGLGLMGFMARRRQRSLRAA
jgi:hypothetical protein